MYQPLPSNLLRNETAAKALRALGQPHLRHLLIELHEGRLNSLDSAMLRSSQTAEIMRELENEHLPMLEEAGFIEWNPATGEISEGPNFDEIKPILELIRNHPDELPADWL